MASGTTYHEFSRMSRISSLPLIQAVPHQSHILETKGYDFLLNKLGTQYPQVIIDSKLLDSCIFPKVMDQEVVGLKENVFKDVVTQANTANELHKQVEKGKDLEAKVEDLSANVAALSSENKELTTKVEDLSAKLANVSDVAEQVLKGYISSIQTTSGRQKQAQRRSSSQNHPVPFVPVSDEVLLQHGVDVSGNNAKSIEELLELLASVQKIRDSTEKALSDAEDERGRKKRKRVTPPSEATSSSNTKKIRQD